ncbi:hypothetical protein CBW57_13920 [Yersinia intermedia]|jgi:hypothetical protein|uniref:Uncharacterized protein n=1 Tax=Yersinia intermedia TaxID=631 RepID=A0A208ZYV0_YERIN|nr:hypothetical protein CBW57_13920 [Yersinia intermedia]
MFECYIKTYLLLIDFLAGELNLARQVRKFDASTIRGSRPLMVESGNRTRVSRWLGWMDEIIA